MKDLFISKSGVNYGAGLTLASHTKDNIQSLTAGGIAFFNQDGSVIDGTTGIVAGDVTGDVIEVAWKHPDGRIKWSIQLNRKGFKYVKQAYVAPVAAVKVLGSEAAAAAGTYSLNLPSSLSVGDLYGFVITDKTKPHYDTSRTKEYSFTAVSGDSLTGVGTSNIIAKLVALVNADPNRVVNAVAHTDGTDNDGIKFTAVTAGNDFEIGSIDGVLKDADRLAYNIVNDNYVAFSTTVVANNPGQGTYAQIAKLEQDYSVMDGNTKSQKLTNYMFSRTAAAVSGGTYVLYRLTSIPIQDGVLSRDVGYESNVLIAVPSGETGAGKLITVLDELLPFIAT